ncbi:tetratricopeptide repeat protein [Desulfosarcina variabilis str. Montpellier]|uniref:S-layer homology domain-containing protein n=1 Tax=Desulfosarcina variabilis TaxID=2300 RepID=UPI003AFA131C
MKRHLKCVSVIFVVLLLASCAHKPVERESELDNPAHHYLRGMELIDEGQLDQAALRFERALTLEPSYPPALAGKALVTAMTVDSQADDQHGAVALGQALELIEEAEDEADGDSQEFCVHVTAIRVYTYGKPKKWLNSAQNAYDAATSLKKVNVAELPYYRGLEAADYFMGIAAYKAFQFRDAEDLLARVTEVPTGRWHQPARALFKKVHKIVRAMANYTLTDVAKQIAIKDEVVRVDVAALLVDEVRLDRLMAGRIPVPNSRPTKSFVPADIVDHTFKSEVQTVLAWNLRGLEPQYNETSKAFLFYPNAPVKRKELAFILEDLLTKITGDEKLATAYFGQQRSQYPDVSPSSPWFNAVVNVVSRNLMETGLSGAFRPDDVADGAELLLAVMRLRDAMNIY